MNTRHHFRRAASAVLAAGLLVGFAPLLAGTASAGAVTNVFPTAEPNTGSTTISFRTEQTFLSTPTVTLLGPQQGTANSQSIAGTAVSYNPTTRNGTAVFDLRLAGPSPNGLPSWDLRVGNGVMTDICVDCFTILASFPTISGFLPTTRGANSATVPFTATGSNFARGVKVELFIGGVKDVNIVTSVTTLTDTQIQGTITPQAGATVGLHDVVITNTDNKTALLPGGFNVTPAPGPLSLTPNVAGKGAQQRAITVNGSGFLPGMAANFRIPGTGAIDNTIIINSFTVVNDTTAALVISVGSGNDTVVGARDFQVINTDGGSRLQTNALFINARPTVSKIDVTTVNSNRNTVGTGAEHAILKVTGTGFQIAPGAQFLLTVPNDITVHSVTVDSPTLATVDISVARTASIGSRIVTWVNSDGGQNNCTANPCLLIASGPNIDAVSPSSRGRGVSFTLTINGTNFANSANGGVTVQIPHTGVGVGAATVNDAGTQITVPVSIAADAPPGVKDVIVTNNNNRGRLNCGGCFAVDTFAVNSTSPASGLNTQPLNVTVSGGGFTAGQMSVRLVMPGQPDIVGTSVTSTTTSISATFNLTNAAPGVRQVRVEDTLGGFGSCTCFTVVASAPTLPASGAVSPATAGAGSTDFPITITGTNIFPGATVSFSDPKITVVGGSETYNPPNSMSLKINIANDTANGAKNVTVKNTDNKSATCTGCFNVQPSPVVSNINPATRAQGSAPASATINGSNFVNGATVSFGDPQVTLTNRTYTASTITGTLNVSSTALVGPHTITVTNPDGGTGNCNNCLNITSGSQPPPPSQGARFTAVDPVRILDTRPGPGQKGFAGPMVSGTAGAQELTVQGTNGVPANANAVVLNVTVTQPSRAGVLAVQPGGSTGEPTTSFLNFVAGQDVSNFVTVKLGANGKLRFYNFIGSTHVTADLVGWYTPDANGAFFQSVNPKRLLETRTTEASSPPKGGFGGALGNGAANSRELQVVGGDTSIPSVGTTAVILNVTATGASAHTHVSVQPGGATGVPTTSNINVVPGQTKPNLVIVGVPGSGVSAGKVRFYNQAGSVHVIADVVGYFTSTGGTTFFPVDPQRIADTRTTGQTSFGPGAERPLNLNGFVPANSTGAVFNVTVERGTAPSFLSVRPADAAVGIPTTSNLNWSKNLTVPNGVTVRVPSSGASANTVSFYNSTGSVHVIVDLVGYYQ